ncbi:uncharacterized protein (DUF983 family) [Bradyrhizobium sp. LB12.1]|jgi:hypothetical protein|uniref:hypothetical protein n=1 Tax=Bradyrhizobium sp. LB12.1 TaxID=3156327 RepID=UPI003391F766
MHDRNAKLPFLSVFLAVWLCYFCSLASLGLFGFQVNHERIWVAATYQAIFAALVAAPVVLLPSTIVRPPTVFSRRIALIVIGLSLSVLGIASLYAGKLRTGIDYSAGVCVARVQMTNLAQGGHTASLFNMVGYLLGLSFFVSTAAAVTQSTTRKECWLTISASVALLVLFSIVAASRTSIALYISFLLALAIVRFSMGSPIPKIRFLDVAFGLVLVGVCFGFILYVFNCRAEMTRVTTTAYMNDFAPYLGVQLSQPQASPPTGDIPLVGSTSTGETAPIASVIARTIPLVGMTLLYFTHSAFTFSEVSHLPPEEARVLFVYPLDLLARTGLIHPPNGDWKFAGRSLSLPGELFHDYRLAGLIVGSVLLGLMIWFGLRLVRAYPTNLAVIGSVGLLLTIAILSPLHSAFDFLGFPFVCCSFFLVLMSEYGIRRLPRGSKASVFE